MIGITFLLHSQACARAGARNTFVENYQDERMNDGYGQLIHL